METASPMIVFLEALLGYPAAWVESFSARGRGLAPLRPRRVVFLCLAPLGFVLFLFHGFCLALDRLIFPGFRRSELKKPLFIVGVPRSGTTFLHRQLARDQGFSTTASWELIFAPAICQRRVIALLASMDRSLGGHVKMLLDKLVSALSGDMDAIHAVGLADAEEDYLALLPAAGCFMAAMAFPASRRFAGLARMGDMSSARRERLLHHYRGLLQRHVYAHGNNRQLLSKNAAFASWAPYLRELFPDAQLVICIREPSTAVSSQLSSLRPAQKLFASYPRDEALDRVFTQLYPYWYGELARCLVAAGEAPLVIEQEWLRTHTVETLQLIYARLEREVPGGSVDTAQEVVLPEHRHHAEDRDTDISQVTRDADNAYATLAEAARVQRARLAAA